MRNVEILKLHCRPLALISYKAFKTKNKKRPGTSFPASSLLHESLIILNWLVKFHYLVAFTCWNIGLYVYCNCLLTKLWRHKFWNSPCISNQAISSRRTKSEVKHRNILRTKRALKIKYKMFFIIFKGLSLKQIKQFSWEGKSPTLNVSVVRLFR